MDKLVEIARKRFERAVEHEADNRNNAEDDIRFARLGEQWPEKVKQDRQKEGRPCLTINKIPAFLRQIVNDARMNKPSIKCHPVDSNGDPKIAEILNGVIKNIEQSSNADIAYDTAIDFSVSCGFGFFRIGVDYACDDTFDLDIVINRIVNPFSIYSDPDATEGDGSDWKWLFVTEWINKDEFEKRYPKADMTNWDLGDDEVDAEWATKDKVRLAEYWTREEITKTIYKLNDGSVVTQKELKQNEDLYAAAGITVVDERETKSYKVTQHWLGGMADEPLESKEWAGTYIPIIPVYGDEVWVDGKVHYLSAFRHAKDSQLMFNYWRPLALDTPVKTLNGWSDIGSISIGDKVYDEQGKPCNVIGKSPIHINRDCYEVKFDDGSSIIADGVHPWVVEERVKRISDGYIWQSKEVTTEQLQPKKHFIWATKPLDYEEKHLPLHPYALGFWLGDGDTSSGRITPGDSDYNEVKTILNGIGYEFGIEPTNTNRHKTVTVLGMSNKLKDIGVFGNKHIPNEYLNASIEQRWELLRGLMDSDGSIHHKNRMCVFTNVNTVLANQVMELIRSLGIKVKCLVREGRRSNIVGADSIVQPFHQIMFSLGADDVAFKLKRKVDLCTGGQHPRRTKRHGIVSVNKVDSVPVQCIAIDAPSHLFLAGHSMIPTHNTATTELVALAPKAPFIGKAGSFDSDIGKWNTANVKSHAFMEYDGDVPPQRQPFAGTPAGALQEALNASDDMKSIIGIHDASLGARSNETSGKAIMARQREGDVSTFHFIDNMNRAIRQCGRVLVDLIPKVYSAPRVMRIIGEDDKASNVQVNKPFIENGVEKLYDITIGRYDVTVATGSNFTTQREETLAMMTELVRSQPALAPIMGDIIIKMMDFPDAEKVSKRLQAMLPPQIQALEQQDGEVDEDAAQVMVAQMKAQLEQMKQQMEQGMQAYQELLKKNEQLLTDKEKVEIENNRVKSISQIDAKINELNLLLTKNNMDADGKEIEKPKTKVQVVAPSGNTYEAVIGDDDEKEESENKQMQIVSPEGKVYQVFESEVEDGI